MAATTNPSSPSPSAGSTRPPGNTYIPPANTAAFVRRNMKTSSPSTASRSSMTVAAGRMGTSAGSSSAICRRPYPSPNLVDVLVWMDLEMTGRDPVKNVIVEIANLITDDELNIVAEGPDLVIHATEEQLAIMEPVVVEMH